MQIDQQRSTSKDDQRGNLQKIVSKNSKINPKRTLKSPNETYLQSASNFISKLLQSEQKDHNRGQKGPNVETLLSEMKNLIQNTPAKQCPNLSNPSSNPSPTSLSSPPTSLLLQTFTTILENPDIVKKNLFKLFSDPNLTQDESPPENTLQPEIPAHEVYKSRLVTLCSNLLPKELETLSESQSHITSFVNMMFTVSEYLLEWVVQEFPKYKSLVVYPTAENEKKKRDRKVSEEEREERRKKRQSVYLETKYNNQLRKTISFWEMLD